MRDVTMNERRKPTFWQTVKQGWKKGGTEQLEKTGITEQQRRGYKKKEKMRDPKEGRNLDSIQQEPEYIRQFREKQERKRLKEGRELTPAEKEGEELGIMMTQVLGEGAKTILKVMFMFAFAVGLIVLVVFLLFMFLGWLFTI